MIASLAVTWSNRVLGTRYRASPWTIHVFSNGIAALETGFEEGQHVEGIHITARYFSFLYKQGVRLWIYRTAQSLIATTMLYLKGPFLLCKYRLLLLTECYAIPTHRTLIGCSEPLVYIPILTWSGAVDRPGEASVSLRTRKDLSSCVHVYRTYFFRWVQSSKNVVVSIPWHFLSNSAPPTWRSP